MGREEQVVAAAIERGLDVEVRPFPKGARTASDAAAAIGCDVAQLVKSLVLLVDDEPIVAPVGGADRLDETKLARAADGSSAPRADAAEVAMSTGFPVGGVAPCGHAM